MVALRRPLLLEWIERTLVVLSVVLAGRELRGQEAEAASEESGQIWGNLVLDFPRGERLLVELDIRDGSRQTLEEDFDTAANIVNARFKIFF
jgi:hypothetical protein